ncbi:hypothetical protein EDB19DRAFT_1917579 [Suillus lakei]|nr:hypothetical protein EDB19DRAFT_1917579 [Suillus lakei]
MNSLPAVRFNEPPVTDYNSMDVDDSSVSRVSLDDLYLGPDEDIEYHPVSSRPPDVLVAIPDRSPPAQADQPGLVINPDLYLGPEDDVIDIDEMPNIADAECDAPAPPEESMLYETSTKSHSDQPDLTNEDLRSMVQDFRPFGSYEHTGLQSIQDRLGDYKHRHGNLPDPSIPQLLEAERPFRMAWVDTSDKLRRADEDLRRMQRAEWMTVEMLKRLDIARQCDRLQGQIDGFTQSALTHLGEGFDADDDPDDLNLDILDDLDDDPADFSKTSDTWTNSPELTVIPLPSNLGVDRCRRCMAEDLIPLEMSLCEGQANDALHNLQIHLCNKAILF